MDKYAKKEFDELFFYGIWKGRVREKTTEDEGNITGGLRWGLTWGVTWGLIWGLTWGLENVKSLTMNGLS